MKVTEPKTPYEFSDPEEEEKIRQVNQQKVEMFNKKLQDEVEKEEELKQLEEKRLQFELKR